MKQETKESVSAFLDDELSRHELQETLDRVLADETLRGVWDRYHLIGDAMRGEGVRISAAGVADEVRARLEAEPAIIATWAPKRSHNGIPSHWLRPVAGAAMAASVAALAVVALPLLTEKEPATAPAVATRVATPVSPPQAPIQYVSSGGTRWKNLETPAIESKLNRYLVDHSEFAFSGGLGGGLPYTAFVSYDISRP
jgi:sigma-E factor negative regulatory protein RseA